MDALTASVTKRLAALWVDSLVAALVFWPVALAAGFDMDSWEPLLFSIVFSAGYFIAFIGGGGATPGMLTLGIGVVDEASSESIGYRRATVRFGVWLIGGWLLMIGWLWGLGNPRRQTWHDKAAHSVVVQTRGLDGSRQRDDSPQPWYRGAAGLLLCMVLGVIGISLVASLPAPFATVLLLGGILALAVAIGAIVIRRASLIR